MNQKKPQFQWLPDTPKCAQSWDKFLQNDQKATIAGFIPPGRISVTSIFQLNQLYSDTDERGEIHTEIWSLVPRITHQNTENNRLDNQDKRGGSSDQLQLKKRDDVSAIK